MVIRRGGERFRFRYGSQARFGTAGAVYSVGCFGCERRGGSIFGFAFLRRIHTDSKRRSVIGGQGNFALLPRGSQYFGRRHCFGRLRELVVSIRCRSGRILCRRCHRILRSHTLCSSCLSGSFHYRGNKSRVAFRQRGFQTTRAFSSPTWCRQAQ